MQADRWTYRNASLQSDMGQVPSMVLEPLEFKRLKAPAQIYVLYDTKSLCTFLSTSKMVEA